MDINITEILKYLRLFGRPTVLTLAGLIGMALLANHAESTGGIAASVLAGVSRIFFPICAAIVLAGIAWLCWRLWLLYRWERGELNGGCHNCGGPVSHKDGRYGDYSVCIMCGSKRKGWH